MIRPREKIYDSLFQLGSAIQWTWKGQTESWQQTGRKLLDWSEVASQPALFQRQITERPTQQRSQGGGFGTTKWPLFVQWWIYLQAPNADAAGNWPSTYINTVMDAVDAALQPPSAVGAGGMYGMLGQGQTLAQFNSGVPLVENVWIEGEVIQKDPVGADTQVVLVVPLRISTAM